jgi:two-component system, cell cycle response regulator DivK
VGDPILVVDDNPLNLRLVQMLLESAGHDVRTATRAEEALASIERSRPRLIVMDLQLPGMDGLQLTRLLKSAPETRKIPIVAVTASAMKGDEIRAKEAGCDAYLSKPIDLDQALSVFASLLGSRRWAPDVTLGDVDERRSTALDPRAVKRLLRLEGEGEAGGLLEGMFAGFLQTAGDDLETLRMGAEVGDRVIVSSTAHRLCGGCAVVGAWRMVELCTELAGERPMADEQVAGLVQRLGSELERVRLAIDDLRRTGWHPRGA